MTAKANATKYVRVTLNLEYTVPDDAEWIDAAKEALVDDFDGLFRDRNSLRNAMAVEPAKDATEDDVPDFIREQIEFCHEDEDDEDTDDE